MSTNESQVESDSEIGADASMARTVRDICFFAIGIIIAHFMLGL